MPSSQFDLNIKIMSLPEKSQVAFAAACAERLLPLYAQFSLEEGWGDITVLEQALLEIWRYLTNNSNGSGLRDALLACDEATPDMDDFHTRSASLALDAAVAVGAVIEACLQEQPTAKAMVDEVAFALSQQSAFEGGLAIVHDVPHFLAQLDDTVVDREASFQDAVLELTSVTEIDSHIIEALHGLAKS